VIWSLVFSREVVLRAIKVAAVVGCLLIAINHGDALLAGDVDGVRLSKMLLTLFVPYAVSTYSSVEAMKSHADRT
jgi:hypothetical protein